MLVQAVKLNLIIVTDIKTSPEEMSHFRQILIFVFALPFNQLSNPLMAEGKLHNLDECKT